MRNQFFPRKMAEYMTQVQLKEAGLAGVTLERDFTFGLKIPENVKIEENAKATPTAKPIAVDLDLLSVRAYFPLFSVHERAQ
jgi:hypothetical protein